MKGKCLCAAVEFEITAPLPNLYQCYCSLCQKQTGAGHNAATLVDTQHFYWRKGAENITSYTRNTGFSSDYCNTCGSPVPNRLQGLVGIDKQWIPVGLLESCPDVAVVLHLHLDSKAPWQSTPVGGRQFGTMPDINTICNLLER